MIRQIRQRLDKKLMIMIRDVKICVYNILEKTSIYVLDMHGHELWYARDNCKIIWTTFLRIQKILILLYCCIIHDLQTAAKELF